MNKRIFRHRSISFVIIIMLLLLLPSLCSCVFALNSPKLIGKLPYEAQDKIVDKVSSTLKKAELLYGLGMNNLDRANSVTYHERLFLKYKNGTNNETKVTIEATQKTVYDNKSLDMRLESDVAASFKSAGQTARSQYSTVEGYQDGYMYLKIGSSDKGVCSPMAQKNYLEHLKNRAASKTSILDCEKAEYSKTEDGYHLVILSEYSDTVIEEYSKLIEDYGTYAPEYTVEDIRTEIKIDKYYWIHDIVTELVLKYSDINWTMTAKITATYSDIDETEIEALDMESFNQVDDLRVLYDLTEILGDNSEPEKGKITQNYRLDNGDDSEKITEYVDFINTKQKLEYTINSTNGKVVYKSGIMSVYKPGSSAVVSSTRTTREQAKPLLNAYFNPLSLTIPIPSYIQRTQDGEKDIYSLKITQNVKNTVIPSLIGETSGYASDTVDVEVVITVENGRITAYDYTINTQRNSKDITLAVTTRYENLEYPSDQNAD